MGLSAGKAGFSRLGLRSRLRASQSVHGPIFAVPFALSLYFALSRRKIPYAMKHSRSNRREFLKSTAALTAGAALLPDWLHSPSALAQETRLPNARPRIGAIGVGSRGSAIARQAAAYGDILAVCDVDRTHAEQAKANPRLGGGKADV
jgi:hypothetical protein